MSVPIIERLLAADNLPSLPTVAIQVLKMTQADDISVSDIAKVIQQDPALTSKVLRVVNSSLFGMSRKISSLQQATVVLGLRTVKVMTLSFSLVDAMSERKPGGFDYPGYWRRSLTAAVSAKLLTERNDHELADEAFVGALLCDIGMLAAVHCAADLYLPVIAQYDATHEPIQAIEESFLGITHEAISGQLLDHWGLPEGLVSAVASHHQPIASPTPDHPTSKLLTKILRASALIADLFCEDGYSQHLERFKQEIAQGLGISEPKLHEVLNGVDQHVKETASMFDLKIGPTRNYQQLQAEAVAQLARLSMATELERAQIAQREEQARRQVAELNTQNRELAQKATTDGLTGVGNRAALEQHLQDSCQQAVEQQTPIGVILMDLDRFKKLNDTFGHQVGDQALRLVGECLRNIADQTKFAARYGGEEFAMVVAEATACELRDLAEEIRLTIQRLRIPHRQKPISFTVSLGAACVPPDDPHLSPRSLIERADRCLYDAKHAGRNRVVFVDETKIA